MTDRPLRFFLPYLLLSLLHLVLLHTGPGQAITISKALLMPALVFAVIAALRPMRTPTPWWLVAALVASWAGDVLLSFPGYFVPGLLGFLAAHLAYVVLFLKLPTPTGGARLPVWTLVYFGWYGIFLTLLAPHLGALLLPVALYGAVLGLMGALAGGRGGLVALGGALFVISDSVLALGRFLPGYEFALHDLAVMLSYLAAQGLIAWGVVSTLRADPAVRAPFDPARGRRASATAP